MSKYITADMVLKQIRLRELEVANANGQKTLVHIFSDGKPLFCNLDGRPTHGYTVKVKRPTFAKPDPPPEDQDSPDTEETLP